MISFFKPTLKRKDMDSVLRTMVDEQIGPGEKANLFARSFSEVSSCSFSGAFRTFPDCLRTALAVAAVSKDSIVAVSPLTPNIICDIIDSAGFKVVFIDVDSENGCPREDLVLSSGASVLYLYEPCCTLPVVYDSSESSLRKADYGSVYVIEDISSSIGGKLDDSIYAGSWGHLVLCMSEDDCVVSSGGGALLGYKTDESGTIRLKRPGRFIRMPDLNASLGDVQLSNLSEDTKRRNEIMSLYRQALSRTPYRQFGFNAVDYKSNCSSFSVFLSIRPDEVIHFSEKHDVPVKMTFEDSVISKMTGDIFSQYPAAAAFYYRTVSFPIYPFLRNSEIDSVCRVISHIP